MTMVLAQNDAPRPKRDVIETVQFRIICLICFAVFLAAALFEWLLPWTWKKGWRSPIERAWSSARTCTTYAFMG